MSSFEQYSDYYDLLYASKNYEAECDFIADLIHAHGAPIKRVLDLGCGTGRHSRLIAERGFSVHGIDLSESMLQIARSAAPHHLSSKLSYSLGDLRTFDAPGRFGVALALFHVVSYLPTLEDVSMACARVVEHLEPNGLFVFDFWNGSGVLADPPAPRVRVIENDKIHLTRLADSKLDVQRCTVDVEYRLLVLDKVRPGIQEVRESHHMRYFFVPELEYVLSHNGLVPVAFCDWGRFEAPDAKSWNGMLVARRKS